MLAGDALQGIAAGVKRGGGDAKAGRIKRKFQIAGHDTKRGTDGAPLQVLFCLP